jgi:hypothetical protein
MVKVHVFLRFMDLEKVLFDEVSDFHILDMAGIQMCRGKNYGPLEPLGG